MSERLTKLGIKQVIRLEWMDYVLELLLSRMNPDEVREALEDYLIDKKQSGGFGERGREAFKMSLTILMNIWITPDEELLPLRDACLEFARKETSKTLILHWVMISTAYPFWQSVADVFGQLFTYQEVIAKKQIIQRIKQVYGDRQTVSRYARYVISSMIAWGILDYAERIGYYVQNRKFEIHDQNLVSLLYESILLNNNKFQMNYSKITNAGSLFPFIFETPAVGTITQTNPRIRILASGFSGSILEITNES